MLFAFEKLISYKISSFDHFFPKTTNDGPLSSWYLTTDGKQAGVVLEDKKREEQTLSKLKFECINGNRFLV